MAHEKLKIINEKLRFEQLFFVRRVLSAGNLGQCFLTECLASGFVFGGVFFDDNIEDSAGMEVEGILDRDLIAFGMFEAFDIGGEMEDSFDESEDEVVFSVFRDEKFFGGVFVGEDDALIHQLKFYKFLMNNNSKWALCYI